MRKLQQIIFISLLILSLVLFFWNFMLFSIYLDSPNTILDYQLPIYSEQTTFQLLQYRRSQTAPSLSSSLVPWTPPINYTISNQVLQQYPLLPYDQEIQCLPKKLGYSPEQAAALFNPNRKFSQCGMDKKQHISIQQGKLFLKCEGKLLGEIALGKFPQQELFGEVPFEIIWQPYRKPVPMNGREYAFARCSRTNKQAILVNNFNQTASERAKNKTQSISDQLNLKKAPRPLTVLLVIFDSVSRQHFYRNFVKTTKMLNQELQNQEGLGQKFTIYDFIVNNAHGQNTKPNMAPLMYGYNLKYHNTRLEGFNFKNQSHWWKYQQLQKESMWKHYQNMGFVTMFGYQTTQNSWSRVTGKKILTDHVATNFWHASQKVFGYMDYVQKQRCFGSYHSHWYLLNYMKQFVKNYKGHNRFGYTHMLPGHQPSGTVIKTADKDVKKFLYDLMKNFNKSSQEDFVIMFASDHGKHSREWDKSNQGYLQNQLPTHIMITNKDFVRRFGLQTDEILKHNTKRLVSRLDWYVTLRHLALSPYGEMKKNSLMYRHIKSQTDSMNSVSLFLQKVPDERSCEDVSIQTYYCTCLEYVQLDVKEAFQLEPIQQLVKGAQEVIRSLIVKDQRSEAFCVPISVGQIISVEQQRLKIDKKGGNRNYKIRFKIQEDPQVLFEVYGFLANLRGMKKNRKENPDGLFPIFDTTLPNFKGHKGDQEENQLKVQLQEIVRVDQYRGICQQISKISGVQASLCICKKPENTDFVQPSKTQISVLQTLKKKIFVYLGEEGDNCESLCQDNDLTCSDWAFELLNKLEILQQPYRMDNSYQIYTLNNSTIQFKDLKISKEIQGNLLGIQEEYEEILLVKGKWNEIKCGSSQPSIKPICPCI